MARNFQSNSKIKFWVRILCLILCALMVLSSAVLIVEMLRVGSYAAEVLPEEEPEFAVSRFTGDETIRVGLMYGTNVTVGFEVRAECGMNLGIVRDNQLTELTQVADTLISVTCDSNLSKTGRSYAVTASEDAAVGGWHLETDGSPDEIRAALEPYGLPVFPAYINGQEVVRCGIFFSEKEAKGAKESLTAASGIPFRVAAPSLSGVSVVDPLTDKILFEYDDPGTALGVTAVQGTDTKTYLITPAKNQYDGIFEFSRCRADGTDGVKLVNILPLDAYIEGVLPNEINPAWPEEMQKAFAIVVRSYTLTKLKRHGDFDLCNTTHCQAYRGCGNADDTVRRVIAETSRMALSYQGEIAATYYSAVSGGVTVSCREAWGGKIDYPYLTAVATPWENYASHKNGSWSNEVSPDALFALLVSNGYALRGTVKSVVIESCAENSSYVTALRVTDTYGSSIVIRTSDKIRTVLSPYVNSANFVVARGGETVSVTNYDLAIDRSYASIAVNPLQPDVEVDSTPGVRVMTADGLYTFYPDNTLTCASGFDPKFSIELGDPVLTVQSTDGVWPYLPNLTDDSASNIIDLTEEKNLPPLTDILSYKTVTASETVTAKGSPDNFVFIGRGWGHGVGLSQVGACNLAQLGYDYVSILAAYFPGTEIVSLSDPIPLS